MPNLTGRLARWIEKMAEFDYTIEHIAGSEERRGRRAVPRADLRDASRAPPESRRAALTHSAGEAAARRRATRCGRG